ncbi:gluconolaconase [bacterium]|nr:gluconolaconase [bacterium]
MKFLVPIALTLLATSIGELRAQSSTPSTNGEFQAGQPLGSVNEAGQFVSITGNVKVYGSFRYAESCIYDPQRQLIIVMNAGVPQEVEPNDGYVSLLHVDGSVYTTKWIGATRDGLTLNHPRGSALHDGWLYTADIDVVRTFDLVTGKPGRSFPIEGATYLNGIAVTNDGTVFVSNTRPPECIYKISPAGEVSTFLEGKPLAMPNGLAIDRQGHLVSVNVSDNAVLTFDPTSGKLLQTEHSVESGNDGLVVVEDGTKYVSSVRYGSISKIPPGQPATLIAAGIPTPASMCYVTPQKQLVIPMNNNNAVAIIKLSE